MKICKINFEYKLQDLWIGLYWQHTNAKLVDGDKPMFTEIWICFIPCFPLHITVVRNLEINF